MLRVVNQLPELIAFVESVETNSFSAAARSLLTTPSAISKRVAKLEDCLGVRLLQRTTRSLSLTTDGTAYYERVSRLLRELEEANDLVVSGRKPRGKLTISTSLDFGQWLLVQSIPEFLAQYPEIQIDLLAGLGITRLLSFQVKEEVQKKQLKVLFLDQLPPGLVVQAVFTHQRHLSPRVRVLLEFLTTYCARVLN